MPKFTENFAMTFAKNRAYGVPEFAGTEVNQHSGNSRASWGTCKLFIHTSTTTTSSQPSQIHRHHHHHHNNTTPPPPSTTITTTPPSSPYPPPPHSHHRQYHHLTWKLNISIEVLLTTTQQRWGPSKLHAYGKQLELATLEHFYPTKLNNYFTNFQGRGQSHQKPHWDVWHWP